MVVAMWSFLERLLDSSMFSPHGICLLWDPELIWLHVASDAVIAVAYFTIPFALAYLVSKRRDIEFNWIFWAFATFILACGFTHVFAIYTLWEPVYGMEGLVKAVTAIASIVTALLLWQMLPKFLAIPSLAQLRQAQAALEEEERQRRGAEDKLLRFRQVEATEAQVRQAQKMEAVGQLTGGIAHDFNNILTVITGTIQILGEEVADRPDLAAIAKLIDKAATRGADLTAHLLAFSRRQPLQPRKVDINSLLVDSTRLLRPSLGEQIEIGSMLADDAAPALVDPSQLTTAILNLALNARDAMPDGGRLTLESKNVTLDQAYADSDGEVTAGNYVMVVVSDTGRGIAAHHLDRIFEPFFTTKEVGRGTGLGLSMVYGFVKQSNGHIKVHSEVGRGTTVRIYLPQAKGFAQPLEDSSGTQLEGGDEAILIVEDDALVRQYVVTQVQSLGYKTLAVSNAREALTVIDEGEKIDLLFTDIIMPGAMNGRQLALEALNRRPSLKVLYTSGYTENAMVHDGRLDADVLLLAKPYHKIDLAKMIRTALAA
jgi:signal transduction histidine kinase